MNFRHYDYYANFEANFVFIKKNLRGKFPSVKENYPANVND